MPKTDDFWVIFGKLLTLFQFVLTQPRNTDERWGNRLHCTAENPLPLPNFLVQLNEYETDQYFLQTFQSNTTVCLIIHAFCKIWEREIVFVLICRIARTISGSQLLQNTWIIKQTVVLLWKLWKKYQSISYSFSCTYLLLFWSMGPFSLQHDFLL